MCYDPTGIICAMRAFASRSFRVNSNTGTKALYVGGNYNSNDNYGFFYFNANNDASNTNGNLGSRHLVFSPHPCAGKTIPLGKNLAVRTGLSRFNLDQP